MNTVAFHTLGCKLNFAETSTIARSFKEHGWQKVYFGEPAAVNVINTCSVTENADRECRTIVHRALAANPDAFIVVVGCYAQLKPKEIATIPGVDLVLGANEKFNVIKHLDSIRKNHEAAVMSCDIEKVVSFNSSWSSDDRTRVFLKVQDGCDYSCTFCTIPLARGISRSETIKNVISQINDIVDNGAKEIVLSGVNLGDFGIRDESHRHQDSFADLVNAIEGINKEFRIRISSIEPNLLTNEIIKLVAASKKFMPHFHIPLQSGSNKILKLMRRRYQQELYKDRILTIKSLMPHCCIGVDVIAGFPGETDDDFMETYQFLESLDVSYLHVFTYSERPNTAAITMNGVVPVNVRKQRNKILRSLSSKKLNHFYKENLHLTQNVLWEAADTDNWMHGYTENYIKVKTPFDVSIVNTIVLVELTSIDDDFLVKTTQLVMA